MKVGTDVLTEKYIKQIDSFKAYFQLFIDMFLMENHSISNRVTVHSARAT